MQVGQPKGMNAHWRKTMKVQFKNSDYVNERLSRSVFGILTNVKLCSIATVGCDSEGHINAAYFCYNEALDLYFVSDPATKHCQHIARCPKIAIAIFDTNQPWGEPLRGLQLFGECHLAGAVESAKALATHAVRFHAYGEYIKALSPLERDKSPHRFYVFRPTRVKILDEPEFGEETFVTAEIVRI